MGKTVVKAVVNGGISLDQNKWKPGLKVLGNPGKPGLFDKNHIYQS